MLRRARRRQSSVLVVTAAVAFLGVALVGVSSAAEVSPRARSVPSAPRSVTALPGNTTAAVHWFAPVSSGSASITGYSVGAYAGSHAVRTVNVGRVSSATIPGLTNGKTYSFRVSARNANGRGTPGVSPAITVGTPTPPGSVMVSRAVRSADVHWQAPAAVNGSPIKAYVIVPYLDGRPQQPRTFDSTATKAAVTGLAVGRSYQFTVGARNKNGVGPRSLPSSVVNPPGSIGPDKPPKPGGYFTTLPVNAKLPSEASCDARVHYSPWEPRPQNRAANHRTPKRPLIVRDHPDFNSTWQAKYRRRITGNFTGTTDEIIQWAACKWGIADDILRADAEQETDWQMREESDYEPRSDGHCTLGDHRDPCPTSFGILQIKWYYNPDTNPKNSSYPMSKNMTAFSLDYTGAWLRGCYEGWQYFGSKSRGDIWGCFGAWYSGSWHDSGANNYIASVQHYYNTKPWEHWSG